VRLELTSTGFAIRSLGRLATRARIICRGLTRTDADRKRLKIAGRMPAQLRLCSLFFVLFRSAFHRRSSAAEYRWSGRRDSNSRSEFGRLACFQLHHSRRDCRLPIANCRLALFLEDWKKILGRLEKNRWHRKTNRQSEIKNQKYFLNP
jgi:hypothetical protein